MEHLTYVWTDGALPMRSIKDDSAAQMMIYRSYDLIEAVLTFLEAQNAG